MQLINTTSKAIASFAACLAIISYLATGVVSAATAIAYLKTLWPELDAQLGTVALLFFFACLTVSQRPLTVIKGHKWSYDTVIDSRQ
jgi:hypothetical protein